MQVGDIIAFNRRFGVAEVRQFTELSRDEGTHHLEPDASGRILVHGLLTATLPTRVGGALNFLAREMHFEFLRPVWTGDTVRCEVTLTELSETSRGTRLAADILCRNQDGKEVLRGSTAGVVLKALNEVLAAPLPVLSSIGQSES